MLRCCMGYGSSVPPGTMPMLLITERFAMPLGGTERYCVCGNTTNKLCHVKVLQWSFFTFIAVCQVALQLTAWATFQDSISSEAHATN